MPVDVTGVDTDQLAHLSLGERKSIDRRAADVAPRCAIRRALPLIADRTQSINVGQRIAGGEYFVLRRDAGDRNAAGWGVVDIGDGRSRIARHLLSRAAPVGVRRHGANLQPHLAFGQRERAVARAADVAPGRATIAARLPLVGNRAEAVAVGKRVVGDKNFTLRSRAADGHRSGGGGVHSPHQLRGTPHCAIGEDDPIHFRRTVEKPLAHRDAVGCSRDRQQQIAVGARDRNFIWRNIGQAQRIKPAAVAGVPRCNKILPITFAEHVGIVALTTNQVIISGAADQRVGAVPPREKIRTIKSDQRVVAFRTRQIVVACRSEYFYVLNNLGRVPDCAV